MSAPTITSPLNLQTATQAVKVLASCASWPEEKKEAAVAMAIAIKDLVGDVVTDDLARVTRFVYEALIALRQDGATMPI